jgi:DNA-binding transcriptional regulator YdaS (Cro superfamily)
MEAKTVMKWCIGRRGRMAALAASIGAHRQQVWQWAKGEKPIPLEREKALRAAMDAISAAEREKQSA